MLAAAIGGLVVAAWAALALWGMSPYGRYLEHGSLENGSVVAWAAATLFVASWTLMIVGMMLPTVYPVLALFHGVASGRGDRSALVALCVAGYLGVWTAFGLIAYAADLGLHHVVEQIGWLDERPWVIAGAVLAVAGAYQFSSLKYRCLDVCRSPRLFVVRHWTGRRQRFESVALGVDSGLFCLGCCWSLMLVVFATGVGSIPFMLLLATAMAVEKNVSWGRRISGPLGVALLLAATAVMVEGSAG